VKEMQFGNYWINYILNLDNLKSIVEALQKPYKAF